ncbi:hypothetical protein [Vibrio litoralis]|uniref:hypothetical protein n=1 Tax=Vibrio litoralis TaxID=335972 RepID=UPI001867DF6F|nr:hypothetical protein [Vibrio litoralis]
MSIENNPLLSEYRRKLKYRFRIRILLYFLVTFCGAGWALNWYYTDSQINLILSIIAVGYLFVKFPTQKLLLTEDVSKPKYQVFAKILIAEREQRLISKAESDNENMKALEDYLSKIEKNEK